MAGMEIRASKEAATMFGIVLIIVGLLAFVSNPLVGPTGFFLTNRAHDAVHILSGLILLIAGFLDETSALWTTQAFGVIYGLIAIIGLFVWNGMLLGFIAMNGWDTVLHAVIAAILLYLGFGVLNKRNNIQ